MEGQDLKNLEPSDKSPLNNLFEINYLPNFKELQLPEIEEILEIFDEVGYNNLTKDELYYYRELLRYLNRLSPIRENKLNELIKKRAKENTESIIKEDMIKLLNNKIKKQEDLDDDTYNLFDRIQKIIKEKSIIDLNIVDIINKYIKKENNNNINRKNDEKRAYIGNDDELELSEDSEDLEEEFYKLINSKFLYKSDITRLIEIATLLDKEIPMSLNDRLINIYNNFDTRTQKFKINYNEYIKIEKYNNNKIMGVKENIEIILKKSYINLKSLITEYNKYCDRNIRILKLHEMLIETCNNYINTIHLVLNFNKKFNEIKIKLGNEYLELLESAKSICMNYDKDFLFLTISFKKIMENQFKKVQNNNTFSNEDRITKFELGKRINTNKVKEIKFNLLLEQIDDKTILDIQNKIGLGFIRESKKVKKNYKKKINKLKEYDIKEFKRKIKKRKIKKSKDNKMNLVSILRNKKGKTKYKNLKNHIYFNKDVEVNDNNKKIITNLNDKVYEKELLKYELKEFKRKIKKGNKSYNEKLKIDKKLFYQQEDMRRKEIEEKNKKIQKENQEIKNIFYKKKQNAKQLKKKDNKNEKDIKNKVKVDINDDIKIIINPNKDDNHEKDKKKTYKDLIIEEKKHYHNLIKNIENKYKEELNTNLEDIYPDDLKEFEPDEELIDEFDYSLYSQYELNYVIQNQFKVEDIINSNIFLTIEAKRYKELLIRKALFKSEQSHLMLEDINKIGNIESDIKIEYQKIFDEVMIERMPKFSDIIKNEENNKFLTLINSKKYYLDNIGKMYYQKQSHRENFSTIKKEKILKQLDDRFLKYKFNYTLYLKKINLFMGNVIENNRIFFYPYLPYVIRMLQNRGYSIVLICRNIPMKPFYHIYHQTKMRKTSINPIFIDYKFNHYFKISEHLSQSYSDVVIDNNFKDCIDLPNLDLYISLCPMCKNYQVIKDLEITILPYQYYYYEKMQQELLQDIYYKRHDLILKNILTHLDNLINGDRYKEMTIRELLTNVLKINSNDYIGKLSRHDLSLTPDIYYVNKDLNYIFISELGVSYSDDYYREKELKYIEITKKLNQLSKYRFEYIPILFNTKSLSFKSININKQYRMHYDPVDDIFNKTSFKRREYYIDICNAIKEISRSFLNGTVNYIPKTTNIEALKVLKTNLELLTINDFSESDFGELQIHYSAYIRKAEEMAEIRKYGVTTDSNFTNEILNDIAAKKLYDMINFNLMSNKLETISYDEFDFNNTNLLLAEINEYNNKRYYDDFISNSLNSKPKRIESLFYIPTSITTLSFTSGNNLTKLKSLFNYLATLTFTKCRKSSMSKMAITYLNDFIKKMQNDNIYNEEYIEKYKTIRKNIYIDNIAPILLNLFLKKEKNEDFVKTSSDYKPQISYNNNYVEEEFNFLSQRKIRDISLFDNLSQIYPDLKNHLLFQTDYQNDFTLYYKNLSNLAYNLYVIANDYYILSFTLDNIVSSTRKRVIVHSGLQSDIMYIISKGSSDSKKNAKFKLSTMLITELRNLTFYSRMFSIDSYFIDEERDKVLIFTNPITFNYNTSNQMRLLLSQMLVSSFYAFSEYEGSIEEKIKYSEEIQKLIFCANRLFDSSGCKFLSDIRYLVSIFSSGIFNTEKIIEERFPAKMHSYPLLYLYKLFCKNLKKVLSKDFYDVTYSGKIYQIQSYGIFTGKKLKSYDLILLEQYLTKYTFKQHKEKIHAIKETLETIKKYQKTDHHYYNISIIYNTAQLMKQHLGTEFLNQCMIKALNSKLINHVKSTSTLHIKPNYNKGNYIREHLSDAILENIKSSQNYDKTLFNLLEESKEDFIQISSSVKEETKGYRETNVTSLETLVGLKIIDIISMEINKKVGIDDICNEGDKKFEQFQKTVDHIYDAYNTGKYQILRSSNDGKKWSTGDDVLTEYITFGSIMSNYDLIDLVKLFNEQRENSITKYTKPIDKILWIIAAISSRRLIKDINNQLYFDKIFGTTKNDHYAILRYGWPEGYFNSLSSLKHSLSYIASSIYLHYKYIQKKESILFYYRVHSDDSFHALLSSTRSILINCDKDLTKIKSFFQSICNLTKDIKSFNIYSMQEYLSNFNLLKSIIPARIVHGISLEKDLSGLSYTNDIYSMCARLDEGLRYGLGNNWYQLSIRLMGDFIDRSHRMIDGMTNSIKFYNRNYIPEQFGGRFYSSPVIFFNFSTIANHIRLLYLSEQISLNTLNYLYEKQNESGDLMLTLPKQVLPRITTKSKNRNLLLSFINITEINDILKEYKEIIEINKLFYMISSEQKYKIIISQLWGRNGMLSYLPNKNYTVFTSRLSYNNIVYEDKTYDNFDDIIKQCQSICTFKYLKNRMLLQVKTKYNLLSFLLSRDYKSVIKNKLDFCNSKIVKISTKDEKDFEMIETFKNINFKTETSENINLYLQDFLGLKIDIDSMQKFIKRLDTNDKYIYINAPLETNVSETITNYMYFGFLYPNYITFLDIFNQKACVIEDKECDKETYNKLIIFTIINTISLISLLSYINKKAYISNLKDIKHIFEEIYSKVKKENYINDPYQFIDKYLTTINMELVKSGKERFCLKSLYDINNILLSKNFNMSLKIKYPLYSDNTDYMIEIFRADISLYIFNGLIVVCGIKDGSSMQHRDKKGRLDIKNSFRVEITPYIVRFLIAYVYKKIKDFKDLDSLIKKASYDYVNLTDIDESLTYNESEFDAFGIYKESDKYYLGYCSIKHERFILKNYMIIEDKTINQRFFKFKTYDSIQYIDESITMRISTYDFIPSIMYNSGNMLSYYKPLYLGFCSNYPLLDDSFFNEKMLRFTDTQFENIETLFAIGNLYVYDTVLGIDFYTLQSAYNFIKVIPITDEKYENNIISKAKIVLKDYDDYYPEYMNMVRLFMDSSEANIKEKKVVLRSKLKFDLSTLKINLGEKNDDKVILEQAEEESTNINKSMHFKKVEKLFKDQYTNIINNGFKSILTISQSIKNVTLSYNDKAKLACFLWFINDLVKNNKIDLNYNISIIIIIIYYVLGQKRYNFNYYNDSLYVELFTEICILPIKRTYIDYIPKILKFYAVENIIEYKLNHPNLEGMKRLNRYLKDEDSD